VLFAELDLRAKINACMVGETGAAEALKQGVETLLGSPNAGRLTLSVAREAGQILEMQDPTTAKTVFALIETTYANHPDADLTAEAKNAVEMSKRRTSLVGQPFTVEGVNVDGTPFDWSRYQGKVVLVDFWATWCMPCLQEIPNIKSNYDLYRDRGFEVVGVNLDDEPQQVQQFLRLQPLPWPTVFSGDPNARGLEHPMAEKCGVEAIPFLVLVDRDGKASALHVRGPALGKKLEELLGPAS
jgi:thiol-disulfide isomerase/thioredoxin